VQWVSFDVRTQRRAQLVDVTERVAAAVEKSQVADGICHVFVPHTTAGVTINEGADPHVARDLETQLARLIPKDGDFPVSYTHLTLPTKA